MQAETETAMSEDSDVWRREIENLAEENSARILGTVLGITAEEAADKFLEYEPRIMGSRTGFSQAVIMARILGTELHTASRISSYRVGISSHVQFTDKFPTVGQWVNSNTDRLAVLRTGSHFVYVGYGMVLQAGSALPIHTRVTHVIFLN